METPAKDFRDALRLCVALYRRFGYRGPRGSLELVKLFTDDALAPAAFSLPRVAS